MFRLAVLVSGGGTNLQAIMDRIADGYLENTEIGCVIASRPGTYAQIRAQAAGIPCIVCCRQDFSDNNAFDQAMLALLQARTIDLVVLAGYLSLLGAPVVRAYQNRIINIHPSLIPSFCGHGLFGIRPHQAALDYGVKLTGATVHFVDEQYDTGPILLQKAVSVMPHDNAESLQQRVMEQAEQILLPEAIRLISRGLVRVNGRKAIRTEE